MRVLYTKELASQILTFPFYSELGNTKKSCLFFQKKWGRGEEYLVIFRLVTKMNTFLANKILETDNVGYVLVQYTVQTCVLYLFIMVKPWYV